MFTINIEKANDMGFDVQVVAGEIQFHPKNPGNWIVKAVRSSDLRTPEAQDMAIHGMTVALNRAYLVELLES